MLSCYIPCDVIAKQEVRLCSVRWKSELEFAYYMSMCEVSRVVNDERIRSVSFWAASKKAGVKQH